jgi:hypothetical protein
VGTSVDGSHSGTSLPSSSLPSNPLPSPAIIFAFSLHNLWDFSSGSLSRFVNQTGSDVKWVLDVLTALNASPQDTILPAQSRSRSQARARRRMRTGAMAPRPIAPRYFEPHSRVVVQSMGENASISYSRC